MDHSHIATLAQIAVLYLLAAASPGPNVLIISQLSLSGRRRLGVLTAVGISVGSVAWAVLAMMGVAAVLARVDWLYAAVRTAGALYLLWFGARLLWKAGPGHEASAAAGVQAPAGGRAALRTGLLTSLTNPKSGAFWTSVFAAVFPGDAPAWLYPATAALIAALSLGWHLTIASLFSMPRVQSAYRGLRRPIDALCGAILVALGLKIALGRP